MSNTQCLTSICLKLWRHSVAIANSIQKEDDAVANQTMTPSEGITAGQIGKFQEILGAALRKSGFKAEPV